ncbi:MAG: hypothetical protein O4806_15925 [Trichodesmium sp. St5_bin8]|nr:hypothetical protein [Trichodesmium sp. St5_bin8]
MNTKFDSPDFIQAESLLQELFEELQKQEGLLAGGQKLGITAIIIKDLQETKVSFGNPKNELIPLTEEIFKEAEIELNHLIKQQMKDDYNFYYLTLNVNLLPQPGAKFWRLTCELKFSEEKTIIQSIFPENKWQPVIKTGVGMDIGFNQNLDIDARIDSSKITEVLKFVPANLKANIVSKNKFKAFAVIRDCKYELGRPEIVAEGIGSPKCFWRIQDKNIQKVGTVKFGVIFKVPKQTKSITLTGITSADIDINLLTGNISDAVLARLPKKIQEWLGLDAEESAKKFFRSDHEKWHLKLPQ